MGEALFFSYQFFLWYSITFIIQIKLLHSKLMSEETISIPLFLFPKDTTKKQFNVEYKPKSIYSSISHTMSGTIHL